MKSRVDPAISALEQFARSFHQDFFIVFGDVQSGVAWYVGSLTPVQRHNLREELSAFLSDADGVSEQALHRRWMKLGVDAWPRHANTRGLLIELLALVSCGGDSKAGS